MFEPIAVRDIRTYNEEQKESRRRYCADGLFLFPKGVFRGRWCAAPSYLFCAGRYDRRRNEEQ